MKVVKDARCSHCRGVIYLDEEENEYRCMACERPYRASAASLEMSRRQGTIADRRSWQGVKRGKS